MWPLHPRHTYGAKGVGRPNASFQTRTGVYAYCLECLGHNGSVHSSRSEVQLLSKISIDLLVPSLVTVLRSACFYKISYRAEMAPVSTSHFVRHFLLRSCIQFTPSLEKRVLSRADCFLFVATVIRLTGRLNPAH